MMLNEMTGYDNLDIFSVEHPQRELHEGPGAAGIGFQVGAPVEFYDHLEPEVAAAVAAALEVLCKLTKGVGSRAPMPDIP